MYIFSDIRSLRSYLKIVKGQGKTIGLVPTMGSLHQGHLSLVERAKKETDIPVCTIYVNPAQFARTKDLTTYPRRLTTDKDLLRKVSCNILFIPKTEEIYPNGTKNLVQMHFGRLQDCMEGIYRKNHFGGVSIIISKLLHIVSPDKIYFGQKDIQQYFIIRKMIEDLHFYVQIAINPTIRESDGLAISSRNLLLAEKERKVAAFLYRTLLKVQTFLKEGQSIEEVKNIASNLLEVHSSFRLEYIELVDSEAFELIKYIPSKGNFYICIAAYLGNIRLIDNIMVVQKNKNKPFS